MVSPKRPGSLRGVCSKNTAGGRPGNLSGVDRGVGGGREEVDQMTVSAWSVVATSATWQPLA